MNPKMEGLGRNSGGFSDIPHTMSPRHLPDLIFDTCWTIVGGFSSKLASSFAGKCQTMFAGKCKTMSILCHVHVQRCPQTAKTKQLKQPATCASNLIGGGGDRRRRLRVYELFFTGLAYPKVMMGSLAFSHAHRVDELTQDALASSRIIVVRAASNHASGDSKLICDGLA